MSRLICTCVAIALAGTFTVMAQPPGGGRGGPPSGGPGSQGGGPRGGGQHGPGGGAGGGAAGASAVLQAIDADGDHTISAREIRGSVGALKKLDKNRDGKLTSDEIHPEHANQGGQRGPGGPGQGGQRQGGHAGRGPDGGLGGPQGQGGPGGGPPTAEKFLEHAMTFDADKDGVLSKVELKKMAEEVVREMASRGGRGGPGGHGHGGQSANEQSKNRQRPEIE